MSKGREDYTESMDIASQSVDRISTIIKAPDGVTIIAKSMTAILGLALMHTVAVGKTFYLTNASLGLSQINEAGSGSITVRDTNNDDQFNVIGEHVYATATIPANITASISYVPPIEIQEGWDVVVKSDNTTLWSKASISGWEE